jgi:hypothetical protein
VDGEGTLMNGCRILRFDVLGALLLGALGCVYPISAELRQSARKDLTFARVFENPEAARGALVIWGGVILQNNNQSTGTMLTMMQFPLDWRERPKAWQDPGGRFIVDVCSLHQYETRPEETRWSFSESGFWSPEPHACLSSFLRYDDVQTYAERYIIVERDSIRCFNIWNHRFSANELMADLKNAGFESPDLFDTVAGDCMTGSCETICSVARK